MTSVGYAVDLERFKLSQLENMLKSMLLLPSQALLRENVEENFARLEGAGIENLAQLQLALKTKAKFDAFAQKTRLDVKYLTLLRREVNSWQPKPVALKDFPGVNPEIIQALGNAGIKNTLQLFPYVLNPVLRGAFSSEHGINEAELLDLTHLTDVARLKYVGPKFARLVVETVFDTVKKIQEADPRDLFDALIMVNEEKDIYRGFVRIR